MHPFRLLCAKVMSEEFLDAWGFPAPPIHKLRKGADILVSGRGWPMFKAAKPHRRSMVAHQCCKLAVVMGAVAQNSID